MAEAVRLLVVDLCGTLVRDNTTHAFLHAAPLGGWRGYAAGLLASRAGLLAGHLLPAGLHRALLCRCLRGAPRGRLRALADRYAREALAHRARRSVLAEVEASRAAGVPVVVASASIDVLVEAFAGRIGASGWIGSELGWDDRGDCTGRIVRDATGRKLALLRERLGTTPPMRVLTDNPEDADLVAAALQSRIVGRDDP